MGLVKYKGKVIDIILISFNSPAEDFENLRSTLSQTSVVGLDAEWKPQETRQSVFPHVCVLQIACLPKTSRPVVFLLDLWQLRCQSSSIPKIHELLRDMFESPNIVKLGFAFKQDFQYISYTFQFHFRSKGWTEGFDQVDQYLDIFDVYNKILSMQKKPPAKQREKLTVICEKILGCPLSKEHQQNDWSKRPLEKGPMEYAAIDAYCLIEILYVYWREVLTEGGRSYDVAEPGLSLSESSTNTITMDNLLQIVTDCKGKISGNIVLKESDRQPKSRPNNGGQSSAQPISRHPCPWDCFLGGDERPKFLCDAMMVGLGRLLRIAGMDTEIPELRDGYESSSTADLIQQAEEEGRVLLTAARHAKHACPNYYKLKGGLKKEDQLDEVFKDFGLEKNKDQISRCTKCNRGFKLCCPLTPSEVIEAATGYSIVCWCWNCRDLYERYLYVGDKIDVYCREVHNKGGMSYDVAEPGLPLSESSMNTISGSILLKESDRQPRSRTNNGGQSSAQLISRRPWDCSLGGDGRPKFLCDALMVDLGRLLRIAGMDTEIAELRDGYESSSTADLIQQAEEEGRVLLTAAKHGKHACPNYYKLKSGLKKEDQLDEVFEAFGLEKIKDQISRCTKCNRGFKLCCPLTPSEAIEAATEFSILGLCMNCQDLYARYLYVVDEREQRLNLQYLYVGNKRNRRLDDKRDQRLDDEKVLMLDDMWLAKVGGLEKYVGDKRNQRLDDKRDQRLDDKRNPRLDDKRDPRLDDKRDQRLDDKKVLMLDYMWLEKVGL